MWAPDVLPTRSVCSLVFQYHQSQILSHMTCQLPLRGHREGGVDREVSVQ